MKKFEEVYDVSDYEVLTDIGYIDIVNIMSTVEYNIYKITFECGKTIECADNHILITSCDEEVFAINSLGKNIKTVDGNSKVISIENTDTKDTMYDIQLKSHHKYYSNNVLSHNTTVVAGFLLHQAIFNKNFTIACLANKLDQSQEILTRIKSSYEGLPWFLQMGVKTWNKKSIELGNGTTVYCSATTSNAVRGRSINCLGEKTLVTVKNKYTNDIEQITMEEMENKLNEELHNQVK